MAVMITKSQSRDRQSTLPTLDTPEALRTRRLDAERIKHLSGHMKGSKKDYASQLGFLARGQPPPPRLP